MYNIILWFNCTFFGLPAGAFKTRFSLPRLGKILNTFTSLINKFNTFTSLLNQSYIQFKYIFILNHSR